MPKDKSNEDDQSRQERRAKRLENRRKMAVHGYKIKKQPSRKKEAK
jgi:hypothetical protein